MSLRANQPGLLADIALGERVLWIGSGVSRDQVLPLADLIEKLIQYLQGQIVEAKDSDAHFSALQKIVEDHFPEKSAFHADPTTWRPTRESLAAAANSYSEILATEVEGHDDDYLLWTGIDVRETYGAPEIAPGPEHELVAILIREGVVDALVTTNWDGLIEKATKAATSSGNEDILAVHMTNESFKTERGSAQLNKIHGCAVLARQDPETYKKYLIAQIADIAIWRSEEKYSFIISRIENLLQTRRSIFLGLSVQDYNLLALIATATKIQPWAWDQHSPAYTFAEKELGARQKEFLRIAYRTEPRELRPEIRKASSLDMYSGPALASFVIETVRRKLDVGLDRAADYNSSGDVMQAFSSGLSELEAALLRRVGDKLDVLVRILKQGLTPLLQRYYDPTVNCVEGTYLPVFPATAKACSTAEEFKNLSLPELAVTLSLIGLGRANGYWESLLVADNSSLAGALVLRSKSTRRRVILVITRDEVATSAFKATDTWQQGNASIVLIQTTGRRITHRMRGLSRGIGSGRSVGSIRRQSWLSDLQPAFGAPHDMMAAFRAEVAL
jgi:hypothetical protein